MLVVTLFFIGLIVGVIYFLKGSKGHAKPAAPVQKKEEVKEPKRKTSETPQTSQVSNKNLKRQEADAKKKIRKTNPTHPCFLRGFKGFKDMISDFDVSPDGLYVAACSPDNTFRIFKSKDLNDQDPLCVYQKVDFYEPNSVSLRQDKKMVAVGMGEAKLVEFYTIEETLSEDGEKTKIKINFLSKSADKLHKTNLKHLFLDFDGKFFVTGSDEDDTSVKAWSLSGESLGSFTTAQLKNHHIVRSEDGRFLAVGAWTSDVMILELKTNRDGSLKSLGKAMTLKGHRQGNIDLSFNNLNDQVVTLSKDQTIKLWNINVRYEVSEDPKCITTVNVADHEELKNLSGHVRLALYTFAESQRTLLAVSHLNNIIIFDFKQNKVIENITQAHSDGSQIYNIVFKDHGNQPYLYSSADDGRINVWSLKSL